MPAGGFKKAFGEHELKYKELMEEREAAIAKKREEEKNQLRNHYGSLGLTSSMSGSSPSFNWLK